jgi:hypothetical protein
MFRLTVMDTHPAGCLNGATYLRPVIGSNVFGSLNWTGPPRASATQTPQIAPSVRDLSDTAMRDDVWLLY